jgi:hypothetical protein
LVDQSVTAIAGCGKMASQDHLVFM